MAIPVVLLPGGVLPAALAYADLVAELGPDVDARPKELEIYAFPSPPPDYTLDVEVDGIIRHADAAGFDRFHLVGYSAGGASSLAFTAKHPDRLLSLTLNEPAWAGVNDDRTPEERSVWERFEHVSRLPPDQLMAAFMRAQLRDDVELPPPPEGPPPPWMASRIPGLRTFMGIFLTGHLDMDALRKFDRPVLFTVGGKSHPHYYAEEAKRLAGVFPDFTVELFEDRHHFDPPHRVEVPRFAKLLRTFWERAS